MALTLSCCVSIGPSIHKAQLNISSKREGLEQVKNLIKTTKISATTTSPHESLQKGNWVKLICGASFEDVADIRNLSLVYALAGVDCIDCAAEASVVSAVNEGIEAARAIFPIRRPWVMVSVNDDEDLHFRKAEFDPDDCPPDCSRPCEIVCPANAILGESTHGGDKGGVLAERCYGCGRCIPVCPFDKISVFNFTLRLFLCLYEKLCLESIINVFSPLNYVCLDVLLPFAFEKHFSGSFTDYNRTLDWLGATTYVRDVTTTAELLKRDDVDAIEIHTSGRQTTAFRKLWSGLGDSINNLRLVAVSMPDIKDLTIAAMSTLYSIMEPNLHCINLWQLDGRPMSGDIGRGATREAIAFALRLASARGKPKGFLQLAGGTNAHTVDGLKRERLFQTTTISETSSGDKGNPVPSGSQNALIGGVAFGGYARKVVGRVLTSMRSNHGHAFVEDYPQHLLKALEESLALVGTVKNYTSS